MAETIQALEPKPGAAANGQTYRGPFAVMTILFFMWGFMTTWNDILIPRFKEAFALNYFQAMLIQFAFFGAYAIGSLIYYVISASSGDPIERLGYKNGVIIGLLIAAVGSALFYPAAIILSYPFFLSALFVVALGFTMLQIAANPYVTILGPERTASSRLNLSQALNSLGTTLGPIIGGWMIFRVFTHPGAHGAEAVKIPYLCFAAVFLILAVIFKFVHLPSFSNPEAFSHHGASSLKYPHTVLGMIAIFMNVGGDVCVGSVIINFLGTPKLGGLSHEVASRYLAFFFAGMMIGRFMAAFALSDMSRRLKHVFVVGIPLIAGLATLLLSGPANALHFGILLAILLVAFLVGEASAHRLLALFSIVMVALLITGMSTAGLVAQWSILGIGLFGSVLWSNIFALAIEGLGPLKSQASSLLVMAILGGSVLPPIQGLIADRFGLQSSFIVPVFAFAYIAFYGFYGYRAGRLLPGEHRQPAAAAG